MYYRDQTRCESVYVPVSTERERGDRQFGIGDARPEILILPVNKILLGLLYNAAIVMLLRCMWWLNIKPTFRLEGTKKNNFTLTRFVSFTPKLPNVWILWI